MAKIDNKKMWESIMEHVPSGWIRNTIRTSLEDQGLKYEKGKIVSIEPESQRMVSAEAKEALLEPKFKIGDKIVEDNEFGMVRGEITDIDCTHYELNGDRYIPISQQNCFKLIESEPESKSTVQKQDPCNDHKELTEFEAAFASYIFPDGELWNNADVPKIKKDAKALLSIARKQFIEEAYQYLDANLYDKVCYDSIRPDIVADFIEDFRKALEKG